MYPPNDTYLLQGNLYLVLPLDNIADAFSHSSSNPYLPAEISVNPYEADSFFIFEGEREAGRLWGSRVKSSTRQHTEPRVVVLSVLEATQLITFVTWLDIATERRRIELKSTGNHKPERVDSQISYG